MYIVSRNNYNFRNKAFRGTRYMQLLLIGVSIIFLTFLAVSILSFMLYSNSAKLGDYTYEQVIVQQGDTLWELAARTNENTDTHTVVSRTMQYNNLSNTYIQPGQVLYIPVKS